MQEPEIQKASLTDVLALQKLGRQTFYETFRDTNSEENMTQYLEEGFATEKLTKELADPNSQFYMAYLNKEAIGYLKVNFGASQTEMNDNHSLEIERIYVLKDFLGKNVGQLLFQKAMTIATENKVDYVWLGVWEENHRALRFYEKNGFTAFDKHIFKLGNDEQTDIMMKLVL